MPKSLKYFADPVKAQEYRNRQRLQNYKKTQKYEKRRWTKEEVEKILYSDLSDFELSEIIHHSVEAIQIKRSRCKKIFKE